MARPDRATLEARADALRKSVDANPEDATAWYGLGRALGELGERNDAIVAFRRCLGARPGYAAAHRELGRCLLDAGQPDAARLAFEEGIAAAESSGDLQTAREMQTFLKRARRALGEGDTGANPAAVGDASTAAAAAEAPLPPPVSAEKTSEARALYKRGFAHYASGANAEAITEYRSAIEVDPGLSIAWNGLSLALAASGDLDAAVEAAQRLIALEPEDPLSHTNLSRLLMQQGKIPEAEDARGVAMRMQMRAGRS